MASPTQVEGQRQPDLPPSTPPPVEQPARWSLPTRIAFRFAAVLFPIYTLYIPVHFIPIPPLPWLYEKWQVVVPILVGWVGNHILRLPQDFRLIAFNPWSGSKDTTYHYVQFLTYVVVAAVAALIWSILDRRRPNYERLYAWFRVYLIVTLAATMIGYGATKIFACQFPPPTPSTLVETYGESSPMHLLWTFMGASPIYTIFAGAVELVGGLLLLTPGLTTLGALVSMGAMGNVLMLNMGYDVPVKIFSTMLLLMGLVLVLPDLKRLADFFLFNRPVAPGRRWPLFRRPWLNRAVLAGLLLFGVVLAAHDLHDRRRDAIQLMRDRASTPLYGVWVVDQFTLDGQVRPPLLTDHVRWQRVLVQSRDVIWVQPMDSGWQFLGLHVDPATQQLILKKLNFASVTDALWKGEFTYTTPQPGRLVLTGQIQDHPLTVTFHRLDDASFLLMNRGFHWINDSALDR